MPLNKKYLEDALKVLEVEFYGKELFSKLFEVDNEEAMEDNRNIAKIVAKDCISFMAIDTETDKVVGVCLNRLWFIKQETNELTALEEYIENCNNFNVKAMNAFFLEFIEKSNILDKLNCKNVMELMGAAVRIEYRHKGIAKQLCTKSVEFARKLKTGTVLTNPLDGTSRLLDENIEIILAIPTSPYTEKISNGLGFTTITSIDLNNIYHNNKSLKERSGNSIDAIELTYLKL